MGFDINNSNNRRYYWIYDEEYDTMPWRIYRNMGPNDKDEITSVEIAKTYEESDAVEIVEALNTIELLTK